MKVTFVNYYYDKDIPIEKYLEKYPTIYGWCKALTDLGLEVQVYHRFDKEYSFLHDGTKYFLIKDELRNDLKWYQVPSKFHEGIQSEKHNIIHINSFNYSYQASTLKKKIPNSRVVIQHHAENPRRWLKKFLIRKFTSQLDGFIFSSKEIYAYWLQIKIISTGKYFAEIMEGSTDFNCIERDSAKLRIGLSGNPVFLWVGRLNENKDPVTVLKGFLKLLVDFPGTKMYLVYSENKLESQVKSLIDENPVLKNSVSLLGFIDHRKLEDYYNSSDYFVLGSHYEGSGYSLVEAMSCGVIPIVTDIPSFRMITDNGKVGSLWKCGDAESFYTNAKIVLGKELKVESKKSLYQFKQNLSYEAIAQKAKQFYKEVLAE